jgi:hypothetical protein
VARFAEGEVPEVDRVQAIDVFVRQDSGERLGVVEARWHWVLDEEAVYAGVIV